MIEYLCGPPKCGKSLLAERRFIKDGGRILYVGTLPHIRLYEETICIHQQRRPEEWDLYECIGDPSRDIAWLADVLERYDGILLDGASFYLWRALCYYHLGKGELKQFYALLARAAALPVRLILIDQPLAYAPPDIRVAGRLLHAGIYRYCRTLSYVEEGIWTPCSAEKLRQLDRGAIRRYGQGKDIEAVSGSNPAGLSGMVLRTGE